MTPCMPRYTAFVTMLVAGSVASSGPPLAAQDAPPVTPDQIELRNAVLGRFDVVNLLDGLGLSPKDETAGVRMIEFGDGIVALDGVPVSGAQLRDTLGADAALVLRLTYLDPAIQRVLFDIDLSPAPPPVVAAPPAVPDPPPPVVAPPPAPDPPPPPVTRRRTRGNLFRLGRSSVVPEDMRVRNDVVVIGAPLRVDGQVNGNVLVVGDDASFGPNASVRGEVTVIGGTVEQAPTAELRRGADIIDIGGIDWMRGPGGWSGISWPVGRDYLPTLPRWDLAGTVVRLFFLALLASVVVFAGQGSVGRVARRARTDPVKSGVVGFLVQALFLPLLVAGILLLVISIVGIPLLLLLPFGLLAIGFIMIVGFTGVVQGIGAYVGSRMGRTGSTPYLSVWVGVALLLIPTMAGAAIDLAGGALGVFAVIFALTGIFVEYMAWTTGLGALILNRFGAALTPSIPSSGSPPASSAPGMPPRPGDRP